MESEVQPAVVEMNDTVAFKCLHYSVLESSGIVSVTVIKKNLNSECSVGVRTVDDSAVEGREYDKFDEIVTFMSRDAEKTVDIVIHDNQDWQPDLIFHVELYDIETGARLYGDDTATKITILDEDLPGKLGFEVTDLSVSKLADRVDIKISRTEGTAGKISCVIRTEAYFVGEVNPLNALEFEDYVPKHETVIFEAGENVKVVPIKVTNERVQ
jgi:hypothetical protein